MLFFFVSTFATGIFAGAAVYINLVEHPARMQCGTELALREFAPSYQRAAIMQAVLAIVGTLAGLIAAWQLGDVAATVGAFILGSVVPFTLIVIFPTNKRLLDPMLRANSEEARRLLIRWSRLHAVRTALGILAFAILLARATGLIPQLMWVIQM